MSTRLLQSRTASGGAATMRILFPITLALAICCGICLIAQTPARQPVPVPVYGYQVVHVYPHDRSAFTEGLEYHDGFLYESTGLNSRTNPPGHSSLRKVRLETGEVVQRIPMSDEYFGEGITVLGDHIAQLTYKTEIGFVYSLSDFHVLRQFSWKGEGWSLTHNATSVFMDDGTDEIRLWDPKTLAERSRIKVHDGAKAIRNVNELEYVEGELYANIWQTDKIARISPTTGRVLGWIDMSGLLSPMYRNGSEDVLNGIAYDSIHKRLFVTGKLWPNLFEIRVVPK
jgi:glutaminyl-peptide cyclotransferase